MVRDSGGFKGNYGLGSGTASQATRTGESWVVRDIELRVTVGRSSVAMAFGPSGHPPGSRMKGSMANFEYWLGERIGKPFGNGHLDVTDMVP